MAREVFFKKSHQAWYVHFGGRYLRLLKGPKDAATKRQADEIYEEMKREKKRSDRLSTSGLPVAYTLGRLYAEFLHTAFTGLAPRTKGFYREKLAPLVAHLGENVPAEALTPLLVHQCVAKHPARKKGTARAVWQAVKRLVGWAEKNRLIPPTGISDEKKPGATSREVVITPEQYRDVILPNIPGQPFKDLVTVAWEVGARPQEFLMAESRHYDRAGKRLVFPASEAKGKKWPRVVYLTGIAAAGIERLVAEHPAGRIFRNGSGGKWTTYSVNCEWVRLRHRHGYQRMRAEGLEPSAEDIAAKHATLKTHRADGREKASQELADEARLKCR